MTHEIPDEVTNSAVVYCINEYVRLERDRSILIDHWFKGKSFTALENDYDLSLTTIKTIIYGIGDKILIRAERMSRGD